MSYDARCFELAAHFLPADAPEAKGLAQHIQDSVEDWLANAGPRFDIYGNRINEDGSLWNLDGKLAARNGNE